MSFAVIQTGGKQYKVSASEILKIERLKDKEGKTVEFKNVLFLNDDKTTEIGSPNIHFSLFSRVISMPGILCLSSTKPTTFALYNFFNSTFPPT